MIDLKNATRAALVSTVMVVGAAGMLASPAGAAPTGDTSAADTVRQLQDLGYNVQINGTPTVPLSECLTTGVHGATDTKALGFTTVYVDVSCASNN